MSDFSFTICTGSSCRAATWVPKHIGWDDFTARCTNPVITKETYAQYISYDRDRQGEIKDVGGFFAGTLLGNRRKKQNVTGRTALTYDLDECGVSADEIAQTIGSRLDGVACAIYSTHKHTSEKPRLRVIVPVKGILSTDAYEPTARMYAQHLGIIDYCDRSTFEIARLFYWPSVSKDGDFYSRIFEGKELRPVDVLGMYKGDWKDATLWPQTPHEDPPELSHRRGGSGGHAADPLTKEGIVGTFCRAHYPIQKGIEELLPDVYRAGNGRFTYVHGSTANAVVVYDDKWVYSNHATDPASRQLLNIFDLCRIHMFGDLDDGTRVKSESNLPSVRAMMQYAQEDPATRQKSLEERLSMLPDLDDIDIPETKPVGNTTKQKPHVKKTTDRKQTKAQDVSWASELEMDKAGNFKPTAKNIYTIMTNDPELKGLFGLNTMDGKIRKRRSAYWDDSGDGSSWTDTDDACLRYHLESVYGISSMQKTYDVTSKIANEQSFHPVRDYLRGLPKWDGVQRVDTLFIDCLGAEDSELNRTMSRLMLTGAVARVMQPGCKFDYCMILTGPEGIGKSTVLHSLAGEWFSDSVTTTEGKEGMGQITDKWIIELGELDAIKRSEATQVKNFISRQVDDFRPSYGRRNVRYPRQCVFFGTTNEDHFLKGLDGNRRFLVLQCSTNAKRSFLSVARERDQIWAEVLAGYKPEAPLYLSPEMEKQARERSKDYNQDVEAQESLRGVLMDFLDMDLPFDWFENYDLARRQAWMRQPTYTELTPRIKRDHFCIPQFLLEKYGMIVGDSGYKHRANEIGKIMRDMEGWEEIGIKRLDKVHGKQKTWRRVVGTQSASDPYSLNQNGNNLDAVSDDDL